MVSYIIKFTFFSREFKMEVYIIACMANQTDDIICHLMAISTECEEATLDGNRKFVCLASIFTTKTHM